MFINPTWTFKRNFIEDPITGTLLMTEGTEAWKSRAYYQDAFSSFIEGAGVRVFHNDNPGENTVYAIGVAQGVPNNISHPDDLQYGFFFDGTDTKVIVDGVVSNYLEQNAEYDMRLNASGGVDWFVGGALIQSTPGPIDFSEPWHLFALGSVAFETEIEAQVNPDGVDRLRVLDVVYDMQVTDETGGVSIVTKSAIGSSDVPSGTNIFRVLLEESVDPNSITVGDNVKFERLLEPGEDPTQLDPPLPETATRVPINIEAPYQWSTNSELHIYVPALTEGKTIEITIGVTDNPISEYAGSRDFTPSIAIFKLAGSTAIGEVTEGLGEFFNDVYFKTRHLDSLIDIDEIVYKASDYFDFEYKVTEYNAEENEYVNVYDQNRADLGYEDTDRRIQFKNSDTIEELFVKQYLPEYIRYMKDINDPTLTILSTAEAKDLKNLLFKNITLMNYFKGNEIQMEFLISIFSSSLGYHYVSVDPDPYNNFIYRVSTTLPERFWNEDIRKITHPLGWDDLYVEIPRDATAWHQMKILEGDELEQYLLTNGKQVPVTYLDYAEYLDSTTGEVNRWGSYTGNAIEEDLISEKAFPFKPTEYSADIEYDSKMWVIGQDGTSVASDATDGLFHDLRTEYAVYDATTDYTDGTSVSVDILNPGSSLFSASQVGKIWKFEFLRSGIAAQYVWAIYRKNGLVYTTTTHVPRLYYTGSIDGEELTVHLRLKMKDWNMPLFQFKADSRPWVERRLDLGFGGTIDSYLSQSVNDVQNRYDGGVDFDSQAKYTVRDGDYSGGYDDTSLTSIASAATFDTTGNEHEVFFNDGTSDQNRISGLFTEFEWIIREGSVSGTIINRIRTILPKLNYTSTDPGQRNVQVILHRAGQTFTGPNSTL